MYVYSEARETGLCEQLLLLPCYYIVNIPQASCQLKKRWAFYSRRREKQQYPLEIPPGSSTWAVERGLNLRFA